MSNIFLNGAVGRIEGKYIPAANKKAPIALVLHNHPMYGGSMDNPVVCTLYNSLVKHGFSVLKINFRGVGRSQGSFDQGIGEMYDTTCALDWLQINNPFSDFHLIAGFSFGAWIAMQLIMRRPEINKFIAVSPQVNNCDFSFLSPCPIPGAIIHGSQDSIASHEDVIGLADKLSRQKHVQVECKIIDGADHFFRSKMPEFQQTVDEFLDNLNLGNLLPQTTNISSKNTSDVASNKQIAPQKIFLD